MGSFRSLATDVAATGLVGWGKIERAKRGHEITATEAEELSKKLFSSFGSENMEEADEDFWDRIHKQR